MSGGELVSAQGQALVRRFTDELQGNTTLEQQTKAAQKRIDDEEEARLTAHLRELYEEQGETASVFSSAQIARDALKECCERLVAQSSAPSKESRFRIIATKPARVKADEQLSQYAGNGFEELTSTINGLESSWKQNHSKVYDRFHQVCGTLDAHKDVFSVFPSQTIYAAVLCGSISLLVKAAVNHEMIADTISRTVVRVSSTASLCANLVAVVKTNSMKKRLASIYAKVFNFFRDVMEWYLKSRTSRLFQSFNSNVTKRLEEVTKTIDDEVEELYKEGGVGGLAMQRASMFKVDKIDEGMGYMTETISLLGAEIQDLKAALFQQRQQPPLSSEELGFEVGNSMRRTLLSSFEEITFKSQGIEYTLRNSRNSPQAQNLSLDGTPSTSESVQPPISPISRSLALRNAETLNNYVIGTDGIELLSNNENRLAEPSVISKLQSWLMDTSTSQLLWISGPQEFQHSSSTRAANVAVIAAAMELKVPFISHLCSKAGPALASDGEAQEKLGLIGLVYSLVYQLLQFKIQDVGLDVSTERLQQLDGNEKSWQVSLSLLADLLRHTPYLPYCIIHNINSLEWSPDAAQWCAEFVEVLLQHQQEPGVTFSLLFTTSGQSRVLSHYISMQHRLQTTKNSRDVGRRGQKLNLLA